MALNGTAGTNTGINATAGNGWIYFIRPTAPFWISNLITIIAGLGGNVLVFVLLRDVKFSFLSYPMYLRFMALSDSAVLIAYGILQSLRYFHVFHIISNYVCSLWMFISYSSMLLSPWLVVGLTVDRFYCVVFPMKRDRLCTKRKATIVCWCLATLSGVLTIPLVLDPMKVKGLTTACFFKNQHITYFYFVRLVLSSTLPCLLILIFNIVIGFHIQRSATFRKRFTSSTSTANTESKLDKSIRPLMLISILAFVTMVPLAIIECILGFLIVNESGFQTVAILTKLWPMFYILYLINFGQNLYILMASSANYRKIMKTKLTCRGGNSSRLNDNVTVSRFPWQPAASVDS
ncbi:type-1 angiotensin II receptor-like [Gigantopelta aegis]|uniref:type-1 angiotensin II receptor-like n=1 Tax=Gigantopelta aegis TaxID=1735272 RepID=UPI001B88B83E|nr:type-1 angiotensin II receptor-like [Gigantopelta aegis]